MLRKYIFVLCCLSILCVSADAATYYVSKAGDDDNNGTSWATAWETLGKVYEGTSSGDTVFFGTGIWRGALQVICGNSDADRTIYACSSFADTNYEGEYHFARIWGSDSVVGWTQHSGNIYKAYYDSAGTAIMLAQGEGLLVQRELLSSVDTNGEFAIQNDSIYAYVWDLGSGYDPDNYQMEASNHRVLHIEYELTSTFSCPTGSYTTYHGLEFKYGSPQVINAGETHPTLDPGQGTQKGITFRKCKISCGSSADFSANNPGGIVTRSRSNITEFHQDLRVVACSLGNFLNHAGSTHGTAITYYCTIRAVVDSCTFYGSYYTCDAIVKFKSGYDKPMQANVVKHSLFTPSDGTTGVQLWNDQLRDSVYGNVFVNCAAVYVGKQYDMPALYADSIGRYFYIFNNTVIDGRLITKSTSTIDDAWPVRDCNVKYNVVYRPNCNDDRTYYMYDLDTTTGSFYIDSNLFYITDSVFRVGLNVYNLTQWRDFGWDIRSSFVNNAADIGFGDVQGGDYSRSPDSLEMNLTYGGKTWTAYGALGEAVLGETAKKVLWRK